ncbi:glycosyltransferase family 2 protein [Clostridium thermarum]|uniref:glycosyltransferase family 2 protein n=1 Tax=Clostridium thermarum TaxID=1716543 RepID=UPI0013D12C9A|nr:glycosyltransferase family 2 protein [Clostridium thermarum]
MKNFLLSIVVPMYYEEEVAEECYKRLTKVMKAKEFEYELLFVNDGSKDKTYEILSEIAKNDIRAKVINFSRNFGHQAAVTAGIEASKGDAVVIIDADLQDPPELIVDMIKLWENGYEVVYAKRMKRKGETWFKLVTAKYFYKFLDAMSDVKIPQNTGDFRLIDRKVANVFLAMPEKNRFIRGMISWVGFNQIAIEYIREERFAGKTKYPLKKMIKFAKDGIIGFSTKPLKLITTLGLISVFLSFILFVYTIISKLLQTDIERGWASIMVAIAFFSGVQLLSLGIVGEYIARIYDETKGRPLYIVKEKLNFDKNTEDSVYNRRS